MFLYQSWYASLVVTKNTSRSRDNIVSILLKVTSCSKANSKWTEWTQSEFGYCLLGECLWGGFWQGGHFWVGLLLLFCFGAFIVFVTQKHFSCWLRCVCMLTAITRWDWNSRNYLGWYSFTQIRPSTSWRETGYFISQLGWCPPPYNCMEAGKVRNQQSKNWRRVIYWLWDFHEPWGNDGVSVTDTFLGSGNSVLLLYTAHCCYTDIFPTWYLHTNPLVAHATNFPSVKLFIFKYFRDCSL